MLLVLLRKLDHNNGFEEKRHFLPKIAENSDHIVDPCSEEYFQS
jgi:hypothetical protein